MKGQELPSPGAAFWGMQRDPISWKETGGSVDEAVHIHVSGREE